MPLTLAQAQQAGQIAAAIEALQDFASAVAAAQTAGTPVTQLSLALQTGQPIFLDLTGIPQADTTKLMNSLLGMANALANQYQAALQAMP